jgi:TPR repeat protein
VGKSGLVLFHEAMAEFYYADLEGSFARFERAAAKGHEESIWILSVVKDAKMEWDALKEAFAKTGEPLGWYFAGRFSFDREQFDFYKKSAEAGCSWGQTWYGWYFRDGADFVEKDMKVHVEWLEKAANQNNPKAMRWLGDWLRYEGGDKEKAVLYYRAGAKMGWETCMRALTGMLRVGEGCVTDLRHAAIWSAQGCAKVFWELLKDAKRALEFGTTEDLDCDFNQLCYSLGWGLYWYEYGSEDWNEQCDKDRLFGSQCFDYYCYCVELQQKSIFSFLLSWNRATGGVKGPGQMIVQMVWEGKETNLLLRFGEKRESRGCILF